ncbi:hypothetical protein OY671_007562 [Metschnikowia pulcherrima]|nr:hypothetical protein OY671_007562 [Metschnikowia pulcherrima]
MVPIDAIHILNPRARNAQQHQEIIDNIGNIGSKRPVTVRRRPATNGSPSYDLVCGEGRSEAFRRLGQREIPVSVVEASEEDCSIMGSVENSARRQHRPIDVMADIGDLHRRGYTAAQISQKIGVTAPWANMDVTSLKNGEEPSLAAVDKGIIPVSIAVAIARAKDSEEQDVSAEAYAQGKSKGKKLCQIRRLSEMRRTQRKTVPDNGSGRHVRPRKSTPNESIRLYQREAEKQQLIVKRSDFTRSRLLFAVEALRDLSNDEGFQTLLRAESSNRMPGWSDEKIVQQGSGA